MIESVTTPVTSARIEAATRSDPALSQVLDWVLRGWPIDPVPGDLQPYWVRRHELSALKGCVLWGHRVVIPPGLRSSLLGTLHAGHPGMCRMKALGRGYFWWPSFDKDVEEWVRQCSPCQLSRPVDPRVPTREWEVPRSPWSRIHIDLAGPVQGQNFLIVVDALSKWTEVVPMPSTTAVFIIRELRRLFATHGVPDIVVSDNGPQFTAASFQVFLAELGIRQALIAPFRPAANGLAERAVRSAKEALARLGPGDWHEKVSRYLLTQHITPCQTTHRSPAELLMGRRLRSVLDRVHPDHTVVLPLGDPRPSRVLKEGDCVFALNFGSSPKWVPGSISSISGPYSYVVLLQDGRTWRRHIEQLRRRTPPEDVEEPDVQPLHTPPVSCGGYDSSPLGTNSSFYPVFTRHSVGHPCAGPTASLRNSPGPSIEANRELNEEQPQPAAGAPRSVSPIGNRPIPSTGMQQDAPPIAEPAQGPGTETELRRSSRVHRRPSYLKDYTCMVQGQRGVVSGIAAPPPWPRNRRGQSGEAQLQSRRENPPPPLVNCCRGGWYK